MKEYYIFVDGDLIPVSQEIHQIYKHYRNKEEYAQRRKQKGLELSLERLRESGAPNSIFLNAVIEPAEDIAIRAVLIEKMLTALKHLPKEDKLLLYKLYFEGISVRELARQKGVYHRSIIYRRDQALEKLRTLMNL